MINWSDLSPKELASAMRSLPHKILYAWSQNEDGSWGRRSVWEYDTDHHYPIIEAENGLFRGSPLPTPPDPLDGHATFRGDYHWLPTLEDAKATWDRYYLNGGWTLLGTDDGSGTPLPPTSTDWLILSDSELAGAIRTIPKLIAYAWSFKHHEAWTDPEEPSRGFPAWSEWVRHDCEEYGCAQAACIVLGEGSYRGPSYDPATGEAHPRFTDLDECKAAYDRYLIQNGWILNNEEEGPP